MTFVQAAESKQNGFDVYCVIEGKKYELFFDKESKEITINGYGVWQEPITLVFIKADWKVIQVKEYFSFLEAMKKIKAGKKVKAIGSAHIYVLIDGVVMASNDGKNKQPASFSVYDVASMWSEVGE